jgi:hypothetical protein
MLPPVISAAEIDKNKPTARKNGLVDIAPTFVPLHSALRLSPDRASAVLGRPKLGGSSAYRLGRPVAFASPSGSSDDETLKSSAFGQFPMPSAIPLAAAFAKLA